jgi:2-iminoacetate synthase ThiH
LSLNPYPPPKIFGHAHVWKEQRLDPFLKNGLRKNDLSFNKAVDALTAERNRLSDRRNATANKCTEAGKKLKEANDGISSATEQIKKVNFYVFAYFLFSNLCNTSCYMT